jgi:hypothetical protein
MINKYITIKDNNGITNIWKIVGEINNEYRIGTRDIRGFISKDKCFEVSGSVLLSTDEVLDVKSSFLEIDSLDQNCFEDIIVDEFYENERSYLMDSAGMGCICDDSWFFRYELE